MKKSLYPLMLSDQVVQAIDALAAKKGTNRSNAVNQILAEYVSYVTPEKRMAQVFAQMEQMLTGRDSFQVMLPNSGSALQMRSMLDYKYKPNVNYRVELYRDDAAAVGELRVALRTQNSNLLLCIMQFFKLWIRIESSYDPTCQFMLEDGRLRRKLVLPVDKQLGSQELGDLLSEYISAFDTALKQFFYLLETPQKAVAAVEEVYRDYVQHRSLKI